MRIYLKTEERDDDMIQGLRISTSLASNIFRKLQSLLSFEFVDCSYASWGSCRECSGFGRLINYFRTCFDNSSVQIFDDEHIQIELAGCTNMAKCFLLMSKTKSSSCVESFYTTTPVCLMVQKVCISFVSFVYRVSIWFFEYEFESCMYFAWHTIECMEKLVSICWVLSIWRRVCSFKVADVLLDRSFIFIIIRWVSGNVKWGSPVWRMKENTFPLL